MKTIQTILALLCLLPSAAAARTAPDEVFVALSMEAHVRGVDIAVGDIAQVTGKDADAVRRVAELSLGSAPAPGYSRVFQSDRIRLTIQRALPGITLGLSGERACRVFPDVQEIDGSRIESLAREHLALGLAHQDAEFELIGEVRPVSVPAGTKSLTLRVRSGSVPASGATSSVPVEIVVDGFVYRTVWTSWRIRRWATREVLSRHVLAGQAISASHFERRRVSLDALDESTLGPRELQGALALRDLRPGETVKENDVRRPKVVLRGATLFLEVRRGAIQARVSAAALEDGAIGDRIRVRTTASGQELMATVRSNDLCLIDLGSR